MIDLPAVSRRYSETGAREVHRWPTIAISDASLSSNRANLPLVLSPRYAPDILAQTSESVPARRRICFAEHITY